MIVLSAMTLVRLLHLGGLIMGFGGALLADLTIFNRAVIRPVSDGVIAYVNMLSRFVAAGLAVLWASGAALIWLNLQTNPDYLTNEKLWAKLVMVAVLTVNGVLIHAIMLPMLKASRGRRLFDGVSNMRAACMTFLGSVSLMSWTLPFVLGKASELNYVTPVEHILGAYAAGILLAWGMLYSVMLGVRRIQDLAEPALVPAGTAIVPWTSQARYHNVTVSADADGVWRSAA